MHIIINSMEYNKEGNAIAIKEPIMHVFNKGEIALKGLKDIGFVSGMEIKFTLANPQISVTQRNLDDAARSAEIQKSSWPIGIYIPEFKPKPRPEGIYVEIPNSKYHSSYDYWAIKKMVHFICYFLYLKKVKKQIQYG